MIMLLCKLFLWFCYVNLMNDTCVFCMNDLNLCFHKDMSYFYELCCDGLYVQYIVSLLNYI